MTIVKFCRRTDCNRQERRKVRGANTASNRLKLEYSKLTRGIVSVDLCRNLLDNGSRKVGWRQSCGKQSHSTLQFLHVLPGSLGPHDRGNVRDSCYLIWKVFDIVVDWLSVVSPRVDERWRLVTIRSLSTVLVGMERIFFGALKIGAT